MNFQVGPIHNNSVLRYQQLSQSALQQTASFAVKILLLETTGLCLPLLIIISVKFQRLPNKWVSVATCKAVGEELKRDKVLWVISAHNSWTGDEELEVPGLQSPASWRARTPGGERNRLQGGSTGSRTGYKPLAIKFKLRIRHTLPQTDSRHQMLIFRLGKAFSYQHRWWGWSM